MSALGKKNLCVLFLSATEPCTKIHGTVMKKSVDWFIYHTYTLKVEKSSAELQQVSKKK